MKSSIDLKEKDILSFFADKHSPVLFREVVSALGISSDERGFFRKKLRGLVEEGKLVRSRRKYSIPKKYADSSRYLQRKQTRIWFCDSRERWHSI